MPHVLKSFQRFKFKSVVNFHFIRKLCKKPQSHRKIKKLRKMTQEEINQIQSPEKLADSCSTDTESMDSDEDFEENILQLLEDKFSWQNKMKIKVNQLLCKD